MIRKAKLTPVDDKQTIRAAEAARAFMSLRQMDAAAVDMGGGTYVVRGRCRCGRLTQLIGMDRMATLTLEAQADGGVLLTAGGGRWLDKLIAGAVLAFVHPLLVLIPLCGAARQAMLLDRIFRIARLRITEPPE